VIQNRVFIKNEELSSLKVERLGQPETKFDFRWNEFEEFSGDENRVVFEAKYELKLATLSQILSRPFSGALSNIFRQGQSLPEWSPLRTPL
jgi:ribosome-associated toxin RatA of RatAB toxin-antitoxin module